MSPQTLAKKEFNYESGISIGYYDRIFHLKKGVQSKWHIMKFQDLKELLGDYTHHLDFACGPGTFIGTLDPNKKSIGVDISSQQIEYAQKQYGTKNHEFLTVKPGKLPFENNQFDVVTNIELIEHLKMDENETLLEESLRVMKPGGRFLVSTPNYHSVWPIIEKVVNKLGEVSYEDQHITHFSRKRLYTLLHKTGFTNIKVNAYQFSAPFFAGLSWKLADMVKKCEPKWLKSHCGLLILGMASKPHDQ